MFALGHQGEVNHHDRVLLHNADQQDDADDRDHVEVNLEEHEREHGTHAR